MTPLDPPLELLFEAGRSPGLDIPPELTALYGSDLGFTRPCLYANFVASVDGVVALPGNRESGQVISGKNAADRFVMGLMRACADAVLIGAGTFRKAAGHLWHAERIFPGAAPFYAALRGKLGLRPQPLLVLVTGSGDIDVSHPALGDAVIATTAAGEVRLRRRLPSGARIVLIDSGAARLAPIVESLHAEGSRLILTEGGPTLVGRLLEERLLDELFLTTAPSLLGRSAADARKSLAAGVDLRGSRLELLSVRRQESFLFLRYRLAPQR